MLIERTSCALRHVHIYAGHQVGAKYTRPSCLLGQVTPHPVLTEPASEMLKLSSPYPTPTEARFPRQLTATSALCNQSNVLKTAAESASRASRRRLTGLKGLRMSLSYFTRTPGEPSPYCRNTGKHPPSPPRCRT